MAVIVYTVCCIELLLLLTFDFGMKSDLEFVSKHHFTIHSFRLKLLCACSIEEGIAFKMLDVCCL